MVTPLRSIIATFRSHAQPAMTSTPAPIKLTAYSHGGGCGCKIAPGVLQNLLANMPAGLCPPQLLVGNDKSDDAAVWQINDAQAIVATTDFFTPIVDDPYDFGRIAATNAISDLYAMGATPLFALALVGMPLDKLPANVISRILAGGSAICTEAGIPIAGGHSIDIPEPIYGLVALGLVSPAELKTNAGAQPGDVLLLGKPLGIGLYSAALRKGLLADADYADMARWTTTLNRAGTTLAKLPAVHALTDVTGFGLAGHLLEICRASGCTAELDFPALPLLPRAEALARDGIRTGATGRNFASYGQAIQWPEMEEWQKTLLTDPQTSGGLLVACPPEALPDVHAAFAAYGTPATAIGRLHMGAPAIHVTTGRP